MTLLYRREPKDDDKVTQDDTNQDAKAGQDAGLWFVTVRKAGPEIVTTHWGPVTRAEAESVHDHYNREKGVLAEIKRLIVPPVGVDVADRVYDILCDSLYPQRLEAAESLPSKKDAHAEFTDVMGL